jgi:hypothetical protein
MISQSAVRRCTALRTNNIRLRNVSKSKIKLSLHAMQTLRGWGDIAPTLSWTRHYMCVSGQRHAPAALYPRGKDLR